MAGIGFQPLGFGAVQDAFNLQSQAIGQRGQVMQNLGTAIGGMVQQRNAKKRQDALLSESQRLLTGGGPQDIAKFMLTYPEAAQSFATAWKFKNDDTRRRNTETTVGALQMLDNGDHEGAMNALKNHVEYLKLVGANPRDTLGTMALLARPETEGQAKRNLELQLGAQMIGEGKTKEYLELRGVQPPPTQQQQQQAEIQQQELGLKAAELGLKAREFELKDRTSRNFQQATGDMTGFAFNPQTGEFKLAPETSAYLQQKAATDMQGRVDAKVRQGINKDVTALLKAPTATYTAAQQLEALQDRGSPAARMAAVFSFMKALDPTSVVRETEQGMVYQSSGLPEYLTGLVNNVMGQGKLSDKAFADLVNTAKTLSSSAMREAGLEMDKYLSAYGDTLPEEFVQKLRARVPIATPPQASPGQPQNTPEQTLGAPPQAAQPLTDEQLLQRYLGG